jgi:hypothetical protein
MQGISPIQPFFAKIRLENICEFRNCGPNSLRGRAGNKFERAGNQIRLFDWSREFGAKSIHAPQSIRLRKDNLRNGSENNQLIHRD